MRDLRNGLELDDALWICTSDTCRGEALSWAARGAAGVTPLRVSPFVRNRRELIWENGRLAVLTFTSWQISGSTESDRQISGSGGRLAVQNPSQKLVAV